MSKYDKSLMECAKIWAKESYCLKGQVGTVIANEGRIVATGYNGTVEGKPNVCEVNAECEVCHGSGFVAMDDEDVHICSKCEGNGTRLQTSKFTVHAEQNAITFCAREGIPTNGLTMYITLSPCAMCAKLIVQAGIKRVVYLSVYKDTDGLKFLKDCGVEICQY